MSLLAVDLPGADVRYDPGAICVSRAAVLFVALREQIVWQRHRLKLFGREIDAPRLSSWIGDADAIYTYSKTRFEPLPWTPALASLRDELRERLSFDFNSVLANLYRDGRDSMGWHSDDERELGRQPLIASLSFGATRRFRLRSRRSVSTMLAIDLEPGSLLLMGGDTQLNYRHHLPKTGRMVGERINLTFRRITR